MLVSPPSGQWLPTVSSSDEHSLIHCLMLIEFKAYDTEPCVYNRTTWIVIVQVVGREQATASVFWGGGFAGLMCVNKIVFGS